MYIGWCRLVRFGRVVQHQADAEHIISWYGNSGCKGAIFPCRGFPYMYYADANWYLNCLTCSFLMAIKVNVLLKCELRFMRQGEGCINSKLTADRETILDLSSMGERSRFAFCSRSCKFGLRHQSLNRYFFTVLFAAGLFALLLVHVQHYEQGGLSASCPRCNQLLKEGKIWIRSDIVSTFLLRKYVKQIGSLDSSFWATLIEDQSLNRNSQATCQILKDLWTHIKPEL